MNFLNIISNNLYLFIGIVVVLLLLNVILIIVIVNQRKRKKIKDTFKEIEDIVNDDSTDADIENTYKPEVAFELEQILEKMQKDVEVPPE